MSPLLRGRGTSVVATVVGIVTFALGMGAGAVAVFATGNTGASSAGAPPPAATATPSASPATPAPATAPPAANGSLSLDSQCLAAISAARTVSNDLRGVATAARTLNAAALDRIIQQIQVIRPNLADELAACHAVVKLPAQGLPASPSPVSVPPSPSTSAAG